MPEDLCSLSHAVLGNVGEDGCARLLATISKFDKCLTCRGLSAAALLEQVMQLTPEQIAGLPSDQQAQVIALQEHMVRHLL